MFAAAAAAGQLATAAGRQVDGGAVGSGVRFLLPVLPPPLLPVAWPLLPVGRWTVARGGAARVFSPPRCRRAAAGRLASTVARERVALERVFSPPAVLSPLRTGKDWGARAVTTKKVGISQESV